MTSIHIIYLLFVGQTIIFLSIIYYRRKRFSHTEATVNLIWEFLQQRMACKRDMVEIVERLTTLENRLEHVELKVSKP